MEGRNVLGYKVSYLMGASEEYLNQVFPEVHAADKAMYFFGSRQNCRKYRCITAGFYTVLREYSLSQPNIDMEEIGQCVASRLKESPAFCAVALQGCAPDTLRFLNALAAHAVGMLSDAIAEAEISIPQQQISPLLTLPLLSVHELPFYQCIATNTEIYFYVHAMFNVGTERMLSDDRELVRRVYLYNGVEWNGQYPVDKSALAYAMPAGSEGSSVTALEAPWNVVITPKVLQKYTHYYVPEEHYTAEVKKSMTRGGVSGRSVRFMPGVIECIRASRECIAAGGKPVILSSFSRELLESTPEDVGIETVIVGPAGGDIEDIIRGLKAPGVYLLPVR